MVFDKQFVYREPIYLLICTSIKSERESERARELGERGEKRSIDIHHLIDAAERPRDERNVISNHSNTLDKGSILVNANEKSCCGFARDLNPYWHNLIADKCDCLYKSDKQTRGGRSLLPVLPTHWIISYATWVYAYRCGCRCASSCLTFGGTASRSIDTGRAGCPSGWGGAWTASSSAWRPCRTACTKRSSRCCERPWKKKFESWEIKSCFVFHSDFLSLFRHSVINQSFLSFLAFLWVTYKPVI